VSFALEPITKDHFDFSHWNKVLNKLVTVNQTKDGINLNEFNYSGLTNNFDFQNFTWQVENADLTGFNYSQWKAFWINAYNFAAVRMVFQHPCATDSFGPCRPINSITEVGEQQPSVLTPVWKLPALNITSLNATFSLDDIEINHLRNPPAPWIEDVRIHAAIVCASVSCPNLAVTAYTEPGLDDQLTANTKNFLENDKKGVKIVGSSLRVSRIFLYFPGDFNNRTMTIPVFLATYGPAAVKEFIKRNPKPELSYFTYDWDLNGSVATMCSAHRLCFPWWGIVVAVLVVIGTIALAYLVYVKTKSRGYEPINE